MLRALGDVIRPLLAFMLLVLTPIGTGEGVHRDQLLDPLFPHVHLDAPAIGTTHHAGPTSASLAIGAGAGAAAESVAPGLTPPVPTWNIGFPEESARWQYTSADRGPADRPNDPPPDPPPPSS